MDGKHQIAEIDDFVEETPFLRLSKLAGGYSFDLIMNTWGQILHIQAVTLLCKLCGLNRLGQLKGKDLFKKSQYLALHERFHELRNDIGVYVQELRDRFNRCCQRTISK